MKVSIIIFVSIALLSSRINAATLIRIKPIYHTAICKLPIQLFNSECTSSFTLSAIEVNNDYTYNAEKSILMQDNYETNSFNNEIRMKAGETVVFLPGTAIKKGSVYHAKIESCVVPCPMDVSFPRFITPNGDGLNDVFKVNMKEFSPVYIFDRYGKLLKVLRNQSDYWDGSYNSENLFSNDYWFRTDYTDCNGNKKEVTSHFTLIR